MRPKKSLGQNFLMHARIAERIADAAELSPEDTVVEVGPGTGMLTRPLLTRAAKVVAIEADGELIGPLSETFSEELSAGKLVLIHADIRAFDPRTLGTSYKVAANIPYYITGEIIRKFLSASAKPSSMTLLVQKEVAERVARQKGKAPKENLLSLSVKAYGTPAYAFTVPRGAFRPAPNVDSAVLTVTGIRDRFANAEEERRFFDLLHAGFAHKRKLLARNLESIAPSDRVQAAFSAAGIAEKARAEDLSLDAWRALARILAP